MLEMGCQRGTGPLTIVTLQDTATPEDLAESFALMAMAFGLTNAKVKIDLNLPEEPITEPDTLYEYSFKPFDEAMEAKQEFWAGKDPIPLDVKAELESAQHGNLLHIITAAWPTIRPEVVRAWAFGYALVPVAGELSLLANILDELGG